MALLAAITLSTASMAQDTTATYSEQYNDNESEPQISALASIGSGPQINPIKADQKVPLVFNITALIRATPELDFGGGAGFSIYQECLVPIYVSVHRKIVDLGRNANLWAEANVGGSIVAFKNEDEDGDVSIFYDERLEDVRGGFYFSPSISLKANKFYMSFGYEFQHLSRYEDNIKQKYNNKIAMIKLGLIFKE